MTNKGMTSSSSTFQRLFILFTLLTIMLLSTLPLLSGKETVSFQTTGATVAQYSAAAFGSADNSVCAGAATVKQLVLRNQGTVADTYYISASSDDAAVASWLSIGQQGITLQPGEESTVVYYITPDTDVAGTFDYTLTITSLYSDTKVIEQTITVGECPNIALNAYTTSQQTCPCSVGVYVSDLANSGSSTETYSLWLADMDPAYYDLSEYQVTLAPGEHQDIYAYLRMACSIYGEFSFTLVAETSQSGYTAELPLALDVQQACYVYNIALGEALIFSSDAPMTVTFTPKTDTTYVLCQEDPAVIPVNIQNSGDISNEYHVFIEDAEDWITAAEPYIKLKGDQEHTTSLVVNSVAAPVGTYSFALKAETLRGDLESVLPFTVEIQQCAPDEGLPAWLKWTLITLLGAVLLAILIVGYFLYTKKGQKGKGGKEHPLMTWAGKHKHLLWALLGLFLLLLLIGILAYPIVKEKYDERVAAGSDSAEEARTIPTLFYNWATALIALGILLLLAFLVWHFKLRKKQKKSTGKTKGKKESNIAGFWNKVWNATTWQKIKPFLKWLWIIFLLLLLLGGLTAGMYFLYNNYKEDASKFLTQQNATAEQETEEIAVEETETSPETADLEEQIKLLQEQIASLEEKLFALSEAAAQDDSDDQQKLLEQITALEEQINALEKQLQDLLDKQTEPTEEDDDTKALEERIDALEEQIKALQALIATLSLEQNQETQEVVESIEEEIDSLEEEKEQLEEQQEEEIVVPEITSSTFKTILAFDVSLSGQIVESGKTRFERGVIAAQTYIQEKGIYSVMIVGKNPIVIRRNVDSETALKVIKNLRPLDTQSNLGHALYYAAEQLNGEEGRIVLISDMQTTDNTDIYDIKKELEEQGIDVVFLSLSQKKSVVQPVETSDEEIVQESVQEDVTEEIVQESPVFDTESQTAGDFVITLPKNSVYSLDLKQYFSDADDDALVYTATAGEHLTALVEGAIALLTPEQDWIGETTIRFAADDEKGGAVESPLFKVIVAEQETAAVVAEEEVIPEEEQNIAEQEEATQEEGAEETVQENAVEETEGTTQTNSYVPWIILGSIIFLIILSLVMGAFVKKFHNDPNAPEDKDHEKKE